MSVRLIDRTRDTDWSAEISLTAMPGGGATAADYSGMPESITITAPATEAAFVLTAVADDPFDHGETIVLGFRQPLPSGIIAGDPNTATVTIIDPGTERATDREVLEALYHATGGPEWRNSTNWLSAAPISEWFGVETDENSRVTSLDLRENSLIGRDPTRAGPVGATPIAGSRVQQPERGHPAGTATTAALDSEPDGHLGLRSRGCGVSTVAGDPRIYLLLSVLSPGRTEDVIVPPAREPRAAHRLLAP